MDTGIILIAGIVACGATSGVVDLFWGSGVGVKEEPAFISCTLLKK